ncbi:MAG: FAD-dependent oxidoreductase [candidate division NC10 bacterium]|nr:FAD-dependent oxidoreductase [candidate division NC10 bacterium]
MREDAFDAIVVGAGPAGTAAAYLLAKSGWQVVLVERGDFPGAKNVMGGILYRAPMEEIIPSFWEEAPVERYISEQRVWLLSSDSAFSLGYKSDRLAREPYNAFTVLRARFDAWFAGRAEAAGAILVPQTVAEELIWEDKRVVGVRTGRQEGDLFASVVILAEGVNSVLARKAGLHPEILPHQVALAVKETLSLPKEKIEDRFNLEDGEGTAIEMVGENTKGRVGAGFIYTNRESLSVGVAVLLSDLVESKLTPHDLLERMKAHPLIRRLLEGGKTEEYAAHLIPEGGWSAIPPLFADGLMIAGDAAMLVNSVHREGSNMALTSGRLAAECALKAKEEGDFSARTLRRYRKALEESFVLQDLKRYRKASEFFSRQNQFFSLYPAMINEGAHEILVVDSVPKGEKVQRIKEAVLRRRSKLQLLKDFYHLWRMFR